MQLPRVSRGALAARVAEFIVTRTGAPFTSREAVVWLPEYGAQSVRTALHKLARAGKLTSVPAGVGKECIYREITDAPDSRGYGHIRVTDEFLQVLYAWALRGPICGDRIRNATGTYIGVNA